MPTLIPIKCGCYGGWMHEMRKRNNRCPLCYGAGARMAKPDYVQAGIDRLIEDKFKGVKHGD